MKPNSETIQCVYQPSHSKPIHMQRHLLLSLTAIIFMLLCEVSAAADNGAFFVDKWGSQGVVAPDFHGSTGINTFEGPTGVAINSYGYIYVADGGNRIRVYKPTGEFVLAWGEGIPGAGPGQFNHPQGLAVDSEDNVYVADMGNHRIQKFDGSGNYLLTIGGNQDRDTGIHFQNPYAVAAWGGNLYVADTNNNRVVKIHFNHTLPVITRVWTNYGKGNTPFNKPRGIAVDSTGNVYVADTYNQCVVKFNSSDAYVTQWDGSSSFEMPFNPRGVAVDGNGAVYVVDFYNHRIQKFASNGFFIGKWGGPAQGTGDGQFSFPSFVAVGNGCSIVVSDTSNNRVQKFACDNTNYVKRWGNHGTEDGEFNSPRGIALDRSGNIYVADTYNNRIQKFTSTGTHLATWPRPVDGWQLNHPHGIVVDDQDNIFVADTLNNRVVKLSSEGQFYWQYPDPDSSDTVHNQPLNHPTRVATGREQLGRVIYVVDEVKVWKLGGTFGYLHDSLDPASGANRSVLTDSKGGVVTDLIYVTTRSDIPSPGIRKFSTPELYGYSNYFFLGQQDGTFDGLALDSGHNFYAFNASTNRLQKFTSSFVSSGSSSYVYTYQWAGSGSGDGEFNHPSDIVVDKDFNIYVVDAENHRIQKFNTVPSVALKYQQ